MYSRRAEIEDARMGEERPGAFPREEKQASLAGSFQTRKKRLPAHIPYSR
jgi:hypothetical protein